MALKALYTIENACSEGEKIHKLAAINTAYAYNLVTLAFIRGYPAESA